MRYWWGSVAGFQHEDHCLAVPDHVRTPIHHCSLLICALRFTPIHAVPCLLCSVDSESPRLAPQVEQQRTNECKVLRSIASESVAIKGEPEDGKTSAPGIVAQAPHLQRRCMIHPCREVTRLERYMGAQARLIS